LRLLLDTHAFLWAAGGDPRLSDAAREAIETADRPPSVSAASFWEIAIKIGAGKLQADVDGLLGLVDDETYLELPITALHALSAGALPRHPAPPVDRPLVAQPRAAGLVLLIADAKLRRYQVSLLW
jgi:PIN domain nuclease of toxin-antitoxin system